MGNIPNMEEIPLYLRHFLRNNFSRKHRETTKYLRRRNILLLLCCNEANSLDCLDFGENCRVLLLLLLVVQPMAF